MSIEIKRAPPFLELSPEASMIGIFNCSAVSENVRRMKAKMVCGGIPRKNFYLKASAPCRAHKQKGRGFIPPFLIHHPDSLGVQEG